MKEHIIPALKLTFYSAITFSLAYTLIVWSIAAFAPNQGKGEMIAANNHIYYLNIAQAFNNDSFFQSRPSAVNYHADGSGGSNKGPSNPVYLEEVKARLDTFLVHNPEVKAPAVPVDLITASGSGLDPHISVAAAEVQVKRIAKSRNIREELIKQIILTHTEDPLWGLFGPPKVNVLKLNLQLTRITE